MKNQEGVVLSTYSRYYMMGVCQRGDSCPYSHDRTISNKGTIPCRFYQVSLVTSFAIFT